LGSGKSNRRVLEYGALIAGLTAVALFPRVAGDYPLYLANLTGVYLIGAIGLNITLGYAGQVSLAHAAFMAIGAYTTALLTLKGVSFWVAMPLGGLLAGGFGFLLGFPALKVRHHYLAMVTIGFNVLVYLVLRNESEITGGMTGLRNIPRPNLLGVHLGADRDYFYVIAATATLFAAFYRFLVRSKWARAFRAMRENELRAEVVGVSLRTYKTMAFAIGAAYAGASGALLACLLRYIDPSSFELDRSFQFLIMVVVGGPGWFAGPLVGAGIVTLLPELLRATQAVYLMLFAVLLILMLIFSPAGLLPCLDQMGRTWLGWGRPRLVAPGETDGA
jgi:branched-chain amino acid transport system permease protein